MKDTASRTGTLRKSADAAEKIRIETNVPFPQRPEPYTTRRAYFPFAGLQIGDSFQTPKPSVASAAKKYVDRMAELGKVVILVVRKQKNGKYRCWRWPLNKPLPPRRGGGELAPPVAARRPRKAGKSASAPAEQAVADATM